ALWPAADARASRLGSGGCEGSGSWACGAHLTAFGAHRALTRPHLLATPTADAPLAYPPYGRNTRAFSRGSGAALVGRISEAHPPINAPTRHRWRMCLRLVRPTPSTHGAGFRGRRPSAA